MTIDNIKTVVFLLSSAFGLYPIKILFDNFLIKSRMPKKFIFFAYFGYFAINSGIFLIGKMQSNPIIATANTIILIFCISLCYKAPLKSQIIYSLFYTIMALGIEIVVWYAVSAFLNINYEDVNNQGIAFMVSIVMVEVLRYVIVKIICKRFGKAKNNISIPVSYWLAALIVAIGSIFIVQLMLQQSAKSGNPIDLMSTASIAVILLINFLIFFLYERIISYNQTKTQNALLSLQNAYFAKQYQIMEETNVQTRQLRHDLRGHLSAVKAYADNGDIQNINGYIESLLGKIEYTGNFSSCGILAIDGIINLKMNEAAMLGAKIFVTVNVPHDLAINPVDITVILSNILDNAVEACQYVEQSKRFINIHVEYEKKNLFISVVNSCDDSLTAKSENGLLTTKQNKDGEIHGLGLNGVKSIAQKYDGIVTVDREPQKFICSILLYSIENPK